MKTDAVEQDQAFDVWDEVYEEVKTKRAEWKDETATLHASFTAGVQGGKWSMERTGRAVDGLR
eukprot:5900840-Amphidinium_carterae.1